MECTLQCCIDYRICIVVTECDINSDPGVDMFFELLGDATNLFTLDVGGSNCQVYMGKGDREKGSFISHHGFSQFVRVLFGLKNAPGTFQRVMDIIRSEIHWKFALISLDHILIF